VVTQGVLDHKVHVPAFQELAPSDETRDLVSFVQALVREIDSTCGKDSHSEKH
jgi:hypothetical protein